MSQSVNVPEDLRPQIGDDAPLIVQLQDLDFYYKWINSRPWQPSQADWDYYRAHKARLAPLEADWRAKRRAHMIAQARPFLEYMNPIHAKMAIQMPDICEDLFNLLSIYDSACEFYVSLEFGYWKDSQALRTEGQIRLFVKKYTLI